MSEPIQRSETPEKTTELALEKAAGDEDNPQETKRKNGDSPNGDRQP